MIAISSTLSNISHHNYPGGKALQRLLTQHIPTELSHAEEFLDNYYNKPKSVSSSFMPVLVHIDGAAAMTGVTRSGEDLYFLGTLYYYFSLNRFIQEQITYESWKNNYPQFHHHGEHPSVSVSSAAQQAAFHRGLYLHKPSGLEELKSELDRFFTCSYRNNYCERSTDLVYFSKEEFEEDYHQYDWLITEDPRY